MHLKDLLRHVLQVRHVSGKSWPVNCIGVQKDAHDLAGRTRSEHLCNEGIDPVTNLLLCGCVDLDGLRLLHRLALEAAAELREV